REGSRTRRVGRDEEGVHPHRHQEGHHLLVRVPTRCTEEEVAWRPSFVTRRDSTPRPADAAVSLAQRKGHWQAGRTTNSRCFSHPCASLRAPSYASPPRRATG